MPGLPAFLARRVCAWVALAMAWMFLAGMPAARAAPPVAGDPAQRLSAAVALAQSGQNAAAREALQALARDHPERPEPLMNLAALLEREGDAAAARTMLEAAVRTSAAHARAYDQLLRLNAQMASTAYQRALRLPAAPAAASAATLGFQAQWIGTVADSPTSAAATLPPAAAASGHAVATSGADTAFASTSATTPPLAAVPASHADAASKAASTTQAPASSKSAGSNQAASGTPAAGDARTLLISVAVALLIVATGTGAAWAKRHRATAPAPAASSASAADTLASGAPTQAPSSVTPADGPRQVSTAAPEDRLLEIYRRVGQGQLERALALAQDLVRDVPGFSLAQLVLGDLLLAHGGQLAGFGQPQAGSASALPAKELEALRSEAQSRLAALAEPPPAQMVPRQFIQLPNSVRQAVAVDVSRSRLYVLDNREGQLQVRSSHYVAIGSAGAGKRNEGDQRTPLGVYQITNRLDGRQLGDFYGPGALPLDYPNEHDRRLGRTGANVWLHGTPSAQYARAPRSTNGCVVLSNDDMKRMLRELAPRRTPVLIAQRIEWVSPRAQTVERQAARLLVDSWRQARMQGDIRRLEALYAHHFDNGETGLEGWLQRLREEMKRTGALEREVIDMSILGWQEDGDHLLVDFTEVTPGAGLRPHKRRQYWAREGGQWKIFSEGVFE